MPEHHFLSLPSEFKSETIKSSIFQLLHGCTSQSLRTSHDKQLVHFSPPRQDLSFPRHHWHSPDNRSSRSISVYPGEILGCFFIYTAITATEKPKEDEERQITHLSERP